MTQNQFNIRRPSAAHGPRSKIAQTRKPSVMLASVLIPTPPLLNWVTYCRGQLFSGTGYVSMSWLRFARRQIHEYIALCPKTGTQLGDDKRDTIKGISHVRLVRLEHRIRYLDARPWRNVMPHKVEFKYELIDSTVEKSSKTTRHLPILWTSQAINPAPSEGEVQPVGWLE